MLCYLFSCESHSLSDSQCRYTRIGSWFCVWSVCVCLIMFVCTLDKCMFFCSLPPLDGHRLCTQCGHRPRERVSDVTSPFVFSFSVSSWSHLLIANWIVKIWSVSWLVPNVPACHRFATELNSGLLEVISPPASYYPDFNNLKETFGDSKERVRWWHRHAQTHRFYEQARGLVNLRSSNLH